MRKVRLRIPDPFPISTGRGVIFRWNKPRKPSYKATKCHSHLQGPESNSTNRGVDSLDLHMIILQARAVKLAAGTLTTLVTMV
jgi:hypothetical protein